MLRVGLGEKVDTFADIRQTNSLLTVGWQKVSKWLFICKKCYYIYRNWLGLKCAVPLNTTKSKCDAVGLALKKVKVKTLYVWFLN